jgi:hypothetical protein
MISVIAAVHPFGEFKILLKSVVCNGRIYLSLRSFRSGHARRICRTVIAPVSHGHRGLETVGTLLSWRNALKPIFPVRNCVRIALWAFPLPSWSMRISRDGSSFNWRVWWPLEPWDQRCFHSFVVFFRIRPRIAERYRIAGFSIGPIIEAASFALWSAFSFPLISACPGIHFTRRGNWRFASVSAAISIFRIIA